MRYRWSSYIKNRNSGLEHKSRCWKPRRQRSRIGSVLGLGRSVQLDTEPRGLVFSCRCSQWTSKVARIMGSIPKIMGIWATVLGTLEVQEDGHDK